MYFIGYPIVSHGGWIWTKVIVLKLVFSYEAHPSTLVVTYRPSAWPCLSALVVPALQMALSSVTLSEQPWCQPTVCCLLSAVAFLTAPLHTIFPSGGKKGPWEQAGAWWGSLLNSLWPSQSGSHMCRNSWTGSTTRSSHCAASNTALPKEREHKPHEQLQCSIRHIQK